MININDKSHIYVTCPPNFATGGMEAVHQLVHKLNKLGFRASVFYYNPEKLSEDKLVHPFYVKYRCPYVTVIPDSPDSVLIVSETMTRLLFRHRKVQRLIWWLSIDNFYLHARYKQNLKKLLAFFGLYKNINQKKLASYNIALHLVQSAYAMDHLQKLGVTNIACVSDYLNEGFFEGLDHNGKKEAIVLYNPKKGWAFTQSIMQQAPEIKWVALENMTPQDVKSLMKKAMVYIDFGHHPGKDRIPREAAMCGCCVITGLEGSAAFEKDLPIGKEFKFAATASNIPSITNTIRKCLSAYETEIVKFDAYRAEIRQQEQTFEKEILAAFRKAPRQ